MFWIYLWSIIFLSAGYLAENDSLSITSTEASNTTITNWSNAKNLTGVLHDFWEDNESMDHMNSFCKGVWYIVSVRLRKHPSIYGSNHICGGVPISSHLVISAASCFFRRVHRVVVPKQIAVVIGCQNRFQTDLNTVVLRVRDIFLKKKYLRSPDGDVAVLILKDPIPLNPFIPIIPLASELPREGSQCFTLGWGRLFLGGPLVNDLTVTNFTIIHNGACAAIYPYVIEQNLICAYSTTENNVRNLCQEDAGGPLICNGTLYGIISGFNDCTEGRLNFFAPVALHYKWIIMLHLQDDAKLILTALVLFAVLSVLILINKHRLC